MCVSKKNASSALPAALIEVYSEGKLPERQTDSPESDLAEELLLIGVSH